MNLSNLLYDKKSKKIYRDGDTLIKVFDEEYSTSSVLTQALNQARAHDLGIRVPEIKEVCKIDNKWAIVSEYIEGKTMYEVMKENPDKIPELMERFVKLQLKIFEFNTYKFPDQLERLNAAICKLDMDAITRFNLHGKLSAQKYNNVCHGDFVPSNVMITPENKLFVLDWSSANHGNPKYDIATTYCQLEAAMEKDNLAQAYLEEVVKQSDYEKEDLMKIVPIMSAVLNAKTHDVEEAKRFLELYLKTEI